MVLISFEIVAKTICPGTHSPAAVVIKTTFINLINTITIGNRTSIRFGCRPAPGCVCVEREDDSNFLNGHPSRVGFHHGSIPRKLQHQRQNQFHSISSYFVVSRRASPPDSPSSSAGK